MTKPNPVLAALFEAQQKALARRVPARTSKLARDGAKTVETSYAGSDDSLELCRELLLSVGLLALPVSTAIDERRVMTLTLELVHVASQKRMRRTYQVEVGDYGSSAAWTTGYTTALRLLLCLPREPEQVRVRAPEGVELPPDLEEPRATQRVVLPAPVLPQVQGAVDKRELEAGCQSLLVELARLRGGKVDHQTLRAAAGVPLRGPLTVPELRRLGHHLAELVRHEPEPLQAEPGSTDPPRLEPEHDHREE